MGKILSGAARDKIDAANREARLAEKRRKDEAEIALPGWTAPEPQPMIVRRVVDRTYASGHKVVFKLMPLETK